jgi:HNH endonuclease
MHTVAYGGRHLGDHIRGRPVPWITIKTGRESSAWKGGRIIDHQGYVWLYAKHHPRAHNGYVREHILLMEKHLGRAIEQRELIHHINGNKKDNRIENLELMTAREHMSHHKKGTIPWNKGLKLHD